MGGFRCLPKSSRLFITWPPGNNTPHEKRLEVSKYVADQMEPGGVAHQFEYDAFMAGLAQDKPEYHTRLEGVIDRAREMAGCEVQVWVGVTVIKESIGFISSPTLDAFMATSTEIGGPDLSQYVKGEEDDSEI